jgi:hypothetical protein
VDQAVAVGVADRVDDVAQDVEPVDSVSFEPCAAIHVSSVGHSGAIPEDERGAAK